MNFLDKKKSLFGKVANIESVNEIGNDYKREFFDFLSNIVIDMLQGEDNFFGAFMLKMEKDIRFDITWPIATVPKLNGFIMYFNPILFLQYEKLEMAALFKHEIYHMMYSHYSREKTLKDKYSNDVVQIALDISVNQFIKNLPADSKRLDYVNKEFNINLKSNRSVEEYADILQKELEKKVKSSDKVKDSDKIARKLDISRAHELWEGIDLSNEIIDNNVKKIAVSIIEDKAPENIHKLIAGYNKKGELSWEEIIKRLLPSMRSGYKKTIMRRDRRQPERIELRGKLPNMLPEITVAIDISASMSDEDIKKIMIEILALTQSRRGKITVIECDDEIRRIYKLRSPKDIRKRKSNTGSTAFSPVFEYMKEKNLRNNILIYFTDGVGEKELTVKPVNNNTIWVLSGKEELSLEKPFGIIKRINQNKVVGEGKSSALDMIREVVSNLAREF
ncbi:MAG: VWA-like domain-containing protein [Clostridium sp.]|nr:VWA-like domain-containing protein [Clostridium sp.]MCI7443925.1 VWA-like domain-containing protein [Clostridium sp.]